jgi:hypothetical protein
VTDKKPTPAKQFSLLSTENKLKIRGAYRRGQKLVVLGDGKKYMISLQIRNVTYSTSKPVTKVVDDKQPRKTITEKQIVKRTEKWLIVRPEKSSLPLASIALDPSENVRSR